MNPKLVNKIKTFDCSECEKRITFKVTERQFFVNELEKMVDWNNDKINDYGSCSIAAKSKIPGHPIASEMADCPFYQAIIKSEL